MKKLLLSTLLMLPFVANACVGYVVAFKGLNDSFDDTAFKTYVIRNGYCGKTFSWNNHKDAIKFINSVNVPYKMYAFSKGAETISIVLKQVENKPEYIITIGAYKTTNVDFTKYNITFDNFFDNSGIGQTSPGIYLNVPHNLIQKEVNKILYR